MEHYSTIEAYCKGINIPPPKWELFDIRTFEENMNTVHHKMPPFKHEFYAIAVRVGGSGIVSTGNYTIDDLKTTVFFNSPYQILQWSIAPDWQGYYIIFSEEFYRKPEHTKRLTEKFPYFLVDNTIPIELSDDQADTFLNTFRDMYHEYHADLDRSKEIIHSYVEILLLKVARLFDKVTEGRKLSHGQRDNDLNLVSRFKALIETTFYHEQEFPGNEPHQVQFYADQLNIHPNHLNAVVKRITDRPASDLIHQHMLSLAKSKLRNTDKSVKEIAFELFYSYPNHFTNFFKKQSGKTPLEFRESE